MFTTIPITVLSFTGVLVVATLVPSYYRVKNLPVLLSIFWLVAAGICIGINTAGWQGSTAIKWQVYCEISIRFIYASAFALQCCSVLLLSRLEAIAATRHVSLTESAKKRRFVLEIGVGFILPLIYIALGIINQGHRYDIIEFFGPTISIYPSVLSVIFSTAPTLLASATAIVYALLCAYWLFLRRQQLSAVLSSSGSGVNTSQYIRLFGLSCMELLWTVPVNWTIQMQNLFNRYGDGSTLYPYHSWAYVHEGFSFIDHFTIEQLRSTPIGRRNLPIMYLASLSIAVSSFLFFAFLGTSKEISNDVASKASKIFRAMRRHSKAERQQKQGHLSESLSQPSFSPNDEVKMEPLDEFKADDIQIEVIVERTLYEEPRTGRKTE
ncbi:hypothetical protein NDA18_000792 [Ustilago nuda]|nr:hypothetical protein NDA18_000792 [Ustilago nuda]